MPVSTDRSSAENGAHDSPPVGSSSEIGTLSVLGLINVFLRYRMLVVLVAVVCAGATAVVILIKPRTFSSTASFLPQGRRDQSSLAGLAAQFGVSTGSTDQTQSAQFYLDLVHARDILDSTVMTSYDTSAAHPGRSTLLQLYGKKEKSAKLQREAAMKRLDQTIDASANNKTNITTIHVRAPSAVLAKAINDRLLQLLNDFNVQARRKRAAGERRFTEDRLAAVREDLRRAEAQQLAFLQQNRVITAYSVAASDASRLEREVMMQQQIYTTLAQAAEQAKFDEIRDTPVLSLIDSPEEAVRPDSRGVAVKTLLAFLIGGFLGVMWALFLDAFDRTEKEASELVEFQRLRRAALGDLRHPLSAARRGLFGRKTAEIKS